jgi:hypothetical protein
MNLVVGVLLFDSGFVSGTDSIEAVFYVINFHFMSPLTAVVAEVIFR